MELCVRAPEVLTPMLGGYDWPLEKEAAALCTQALSGWRCSRRAGGREQHSATLKLTRTDLMVKNGTFDKSRGRLTFNKGVKKLLLRICSSLTAKGYKLHFD